MGQKVSPIGMRVGVIRDWDSRWYAEKSQYGDLLVEDIKIREYLEKNYREAYISRIEIERTSQKDCRIIIRCGRPGSITGQGDDRRNNRRDNRRSDSHEQGDIQKARMESLQNNIKKLSSAENIKIDIIPVANVDLDARLVARKICDQLEQRQSFRIAQKKAIQSTMRAGAKGIKTVAKGRLGGAEIARAEGYSRGVVPLHTLRSDIDYASEEAHTTYGKLGVKVWICRGEVKPGEMVKEPEAPVSRNAGDRPRTRRNYGDAQRPARASQRRTEAPAETASQPAETGGEE